MLYSLINLGYSGILLINSAWLAECAAITMGLSPSLLHRLYHYQIDVL
ncbi:hypothetical protein PALI_a1854 [Pseudoalteromonas aliena SW19]|uniref:Uncharacterized protein n=1 Tax=Pseudoalteromonas aliena SW19 TaxID=1314866 RepID=A0ABR9DW44_9GAMM|nr:hypothetical protein [Pseudoalteromonas aliena SW19]